jgi:DNA polymerase-1
MGETLVMDCETDGLLDTITTIWCVGIQKAEGGPVDVYTDHMEGYPSMAEAMARLKAADRVIAHNGLGFDMPAINRFYPGTLRFEQMYDTMVAGMLAEPERRSHAIKSYGEQFGAPKGDHSDWTQCSQAMLDYMIQDVEIGRQVYDYVSRRVASEEALKTEHQVQWTLTLMERHGYRLDVEKAQELEAELRGESSDIEYRLEQVFGHQYVPKKATWDWGDCRWTSIDVITPKADNRRYCYTKGAAFTPIKPEMFNPGSRQQIARRLMARYPEWKPREWTQTGQPKIDEKSLAGLQYPEARLLNRYLNVSKMLGQLADGKAAWLKLVTQQGYVHGRVKSIGCRTHRSSHFAPNMAQVSKKDLRMREVWIPDEGHVQVGVDASGLELRMLGHYLARYDGGRYATAAASGKSEDGTDVHTMTQKVVGFHSRDLVKALTYATLYGAGNAKLGEIANKDRHQAGAKVVTKGQEPKLGAKVRRLIEDGIEGFKKLDGICKAKDKAQGYIKGLDGRRVDTAGQHSALNTVLQSAGAITVKKAIAIFHFELCREAGLVDEDYMPVGWHYLAQVHDEVQLSADPAIAAKLGQLFIEAIRKAGVDLGLRVPLDGESMIGANWAATH